MADLDLQIKGGGAEEGGHPDPEMRGDPVSKIFFRPPFALKIRGERGTGPWAPPLDPPLMTTTGFVCRLPRVQILGHG